MDWSTHPHNGLIHASPQWTRPCITTMDSSMHAYNGLVHLSPQWTRPHEPIMDSSTCAQNGLVHLCPKWTRPCILTMDSSTCPHNGLVHLCLQWNSPTAVVRHSTALERVALSLEDENEGAHGNGCQGDEDRRTSADDASQLNGRLRLVSTCRNKGKTG